MAGYTSATTVCFAPNPPPILGLMTLILDLGISRAWARILLVWNGIWVDATTFSLPYTSRWVYARKVSIMACWLALVWYTRSITWVQPANACSRSPWLSMPEAQRLRLLSAPTSQRLFQSSSGCTSIFASLASCMSSTGSRTSYFTRMRRMAWSTTASSLPATIATASPANRSLRSSISRS